MRGPSPVFICLLALPCFAAGSWEGLPDENPAAFLDSFHDGSDCGRTVRGSQTQETEREPLKLRRRGLRPHSIPWIVVQTVQPLHDLKQRLDGRSGYGIGVQWLREHSDRRASRTRLEWNTFAEGSPAQDPHTYVKNYGLGWDHLTSLNPGRRHGYLVTGIGVSRWLVERGSPNGVDARWSTKLSLTGGLGFRLAEGMNLEARYVITSLDRTFDANSLVLSLGWRP